MKKAIGIGILLIVLGCSSQLNDKARRDHLLMPKSGSKAHTEWIANYGDSAESWQLFTLSFHTKYIQQLTAQVNALKAALALYPDPNELIIVQWNDDSALIECVADVNEPCIFTHIVCGKHPDPNAATNKTN